MWQVCLWTDYLVFSYIIIWLSSMQTGSERGAGGVQIVFRCFCSLRFIRGYI